MHVLVAYASRHGATQGIAERIAERLRAGGLDVDLREVSSVKDPTGYDAFVVGSAAYMFHWLKQASAFVRHNRATLARKPTWLFSSGPLGTEAVNEKGVDQKVATVPKEMPELMTAVGARGHMVFFGAMERGRKPIGFAERFAELLPAARDAMPYGDFRDWPEIEGWAASIAHELTPVTTG
jgi:menaquinone-dependent protoporphyrinogen oxidase